MINQEFRVLIENKEQSSKVQETLFAHGVIWNGGQFDIRHTDKKYLYVEKIYDEYKILYGGDVTSKIKTLSYDEFMKQYGKVPRKHAELIKAWADGAEIQYKAFGDWYDCTDNLPSWDDKAEYRIKPDTVEVQVSDGIAKEGDTVYWLGEGWEEEGPEEFIFDTNNDPKGHYRNMKGYPDVYSLKKPVQRYTLDY